MGETITVDNMPTYLARPDGEIKAGILVIHEVWGLSDHIKSVADRLANEGYLALAPDLMSGNGIDTKELEPLAEDLFNPEKRNAAQPKLRQLMTPMQNPDFGKSVLAGAKACFDYLYNLPETGQKVAVIGFCFGGTYSFSLAVNEPRLKLALPFYGHADFPINQLKQIACPIHAFYGQNDDGLTEQMAELPDMMQAASVAYEQKVYDGCGHAFFNDTNKFAYNQAAATDAWQKVLAKLGKI